MLSSHPRLQMFARALIYGAAINVAVVAFGIIWGQASFGVHAGYRVVAHGHTFVVTRDHGFVKAICVWRRDPGIAFAPDIKLIDAPPPRWARIDGATASVLMSDDPAGLHAASYAAVGYGFPLIAMKGGVLYVPWAAKPVRPDYWPSLPDTGVMSRGTSRQLPREPRTLPLTPVLVGFAVNTAFYAALWATYHAFRAWKRGYRFNVMDA